MIQNSFFQFMISKGLSPNQYYLLCCLFDSCDCFKINSMLEMRHLIAEGWVTKEHRLTDKATELITQGDKLFASAKKLTPIKLMGSDFKDNILKYQNLFPKGILPSGKSARSSPANLEKSFIWFFKTYRYDWDLIFKATTAYLLKQQKENWKFCRTSQYFIRKDDSSDLADMCEFLKNNSDKHLNEPTHKVRVV